MLKIVQLKREMIEQDLLKELKEIQIEHRELLKENKKNGGGSFVGEREMAVDVELREKVEKEGEKERKELGEKHQRKIDELRHMRRVLKEECWDGMAQHKQSVTGIQTKVVVFNFGVKREKKVSRKKVQMGKWFGRMQNLENRFWGFEQQQRGKGRTKEKTEKMERTSRGSTRRRKHRNC